jgi:hypothetical protein
MITDVHRKRSVSPWLVTAIAVLFALPLVVGAAPAGGELPPGDRVCDFFEGPSWEDPQCCRCEFSDLGDPLGDPSNDRECIQDLYGHTNCETGSAGEGCWTGGLGCFLN